MKDAAIVLGAITGLLVGGWLAMYMLHESGDVGVGVTAVSGGIPGTILGGWIGLKVLDRWN